MPGTPTHRLLRDRLELIKTADQLTEGRPEYGVGRGAVPAEHAWCGSGHRDSKERFVDTLGIISDALRSGEISSENSTSDDFPTMPMPTRPFQEHISSWNPGNPGTAGRYGTNQRPQVASSLLVASAPEDARRSLDLCVEHVQP